MSKIDFTIPRDAGGHPPDGTIWTGEIQRLAFTDTCTAATEVTVPGPWYSFYATNVCHIVFGGKTDLRPATATGDDTCYPIPSGSWTEPVYIPDNGELRGGDDD